MIMDTKIIQEIKNLEDWVKVMRGMNGKQVAVMEFSQAYGSVVDIDAEIAFRDLLRVVDGLPKLLDDLPSEPTRRVAQAVIDRINRLLNPKHFTVDFGQWKNMHHANMEAIIESIPIFHELKFDGDLFISNATNIYAEIENLKEKFAKSDEISEASKIVLRAQLELLHKTVSRF
ncbi:hypothetical protein DBR41_23010, partial [Pseudomonas sp. HMWF010]